MTGLDPVQGSLLAMDHANGPCAQLPRRTTIFSPGLKRETDVSSWGLDAQSRHLSNGQEASLQC